MHFLKFITSLVFSFLAAISIAASAQTVNAVCEHQLTTFNSDPRFHWTIGFDLHRRPPDLFASQLAVLTKPYMTALPAGLSTLEQSFYGGIFKLLRDRKQVFRLMKQFEADIKSLKSRANFSRAAEALFRVYEVPYGFKVTTTQSAMPSDEYLKLISEGKIVLDQGQAAQLELTLSPEFRARPGRWVHGQFTHRLQWHLVLRDLIQNPENYGSPTVQEVYNLYCRIGILSLSTDKNLDWSNTGLGPRVNPDGDNHRLFFQLFDSPENNGSSPGFYHEYRSYWPEAIPAS